MSLPPKLVSLLSSVPLAMSLTSAAPLVLVEDGQPKAAIWHEGEAADAAAELAGTLEKISGAKLEVKMANAQAQPGLGEPAILVGRLAVKSGIGGIPATLSKDGYRVQRKGNHLLIAGEHALLPPEEEEGEPKKRRRRRSFSGSTYYAACHFLETLGVRWFFDNAIGTVMPKSKTISVDKLDITEKPDFISRSIWGPNWHNPTWKWRNRVGGMSMSAGHDWAHLPAKKYAEEHPEYYALRGEERRPGNWLCTSNKDVPRLFAENLISSLMTMKGDGKDIRSASISPPDGRGFCQCDNCRAQDVPGYLEISSGTTCMSDRYQLFYNSIAARVKQASPDTILNFYAYSDYSRPPKRVTKAPDNLCAWVAPIRFCRLHSLSNERCESRQRLRKVVEGWNAVVSMMGWREYNYNLAELTAPFSKITIFKEDIPYLNKMGCLGINIESLAHWHIYGPHTYLVSKLIWDADADVDAIMDDFYTRFCGKAAPHVKAYWERIDRAFATTNAHAGSFYAIHTIWTPELFAACKTDLEAAAEATDSELIGKRVEMFRSGLENVRYYLALRDATNRCDFVKAKKDYDAWLAHMDGIRKAGYHSIGEYKLGYAPRFLGKPVLQGHERVTGENQLLARLPDEWWLRYDPEDKGEANGWQKGGAKGWRKVNTYSKTLDEQGIEEQLTWMWYYTAVDVPEIPEGKRLFLWFAEIDGANTYVFLNGEPAGEGRPKRKPMEVEITGKLKKGKNLVAVKIDHSRISELMLGGIIKPAMIYAAPPAADAEE